METVEKWRLNVNRNVKKYYELYLIKIFTYTIIQFTDYPATLCTKFMKNQQSGITFSHVVWLSTDFSHKLYDGKISYAFSALRPLSPRLDNVLLSKEKNNWLWTSYCLWKLPEIINWSSPPRNCHEVLSIVMKSCRALTNIDSYLMVLIDCHTGLVRTTIALNRYRRNGILKTIRNDVLKDIAQPSLECIKLRRWRGFEQ